MVTSLHILFLEINSLNSMRNARKYFIRYCPTSICYSLNRIILVEQDCRIVFLTIYSCQVDHAHIHADIAYYRSRLAVNIETSSAVSKAAVESVGITDWHNANPRFPFYDATSAVSNSLSYFIFLNLYYSRL